MVSPAVAAAQARRANRDAGKLDQLFVDLVANAVDLTVKKRMRLATEWLKNKVVLNLSVPVVKQVVTTRSGAKKTIVTERSKPGEFPRADTTVGMKTIIAEVKQEGTAIDGYVGTPIDYMVTLELSKRLNRKWLVRTFLEERKNIRRMLEGPPL